jgi:hypothetical protein
VLSWEEFRDFIAHIKPDGDSAFYRARYPNSWWWTPQIDFLAGILYAGQVANWQRGGGKGSRPKQPKRPKDRSMSARKHDPQNASELAARKQKLEDELAKRRAVS